VGPDALRPFLGLPYRELGRDRAGVDCWGLVRLVYADLLAIPLPSFDTVWPHDPAAVGAEIGRNVPLWMPVDAADARFLDVVVCERRGLPDHVGLAVPPGRLFHVRAGVSASIVRTEADPYLRQRPHRPHFRHRDLA
jgi:cell wall-associated NlpC family hydrolase